MYIGPTPADPFGGHAFDIFDALERAEQQRAAEPLPPPALPDVAEPSVAPEPVPDIAPDPQVTAMTPIPGDGAPAGAPAEPVRQAETVEQQAEAETLSAHSVSVSAAPQPVEGAAPMSEPQPATPPTPANDSTPSEPAIRPIVIGAEEAPPAEKKRGWWRR